jgi:hypothetical protein
MIPGCSMGVMMREGALGGIGRVDRIPWWRFGHAGEAAWRLRSLCDGESAR